MVRNLIAFGLLTAVALASLAAGRPADRGLAAVCADLDGAVVVDEVPDELRMYIEGDVERGAAECPKACAVTCLGGGCNVTCANGRATCLCKISGAPLCACIGCP